MGSGTVQAEGVRRTLSALPAFVTRTFRAYCRYPEVIQTGLGETNGDVLEEDFLGRG